MASEAEQKDLVSHVEDQRLEELDQNYVKFTKGKQTEDFQLAREAASWIQEKLISYLATEDKVPETTLDDPTEPSELKVRLLLAASETAIWVSSNKHLSESSSSSSSSSASSLNHGVDWSVAFGWFTDALKLIPKTAQMRPALLNEMAGSLISLADSDPNGLAYRQQLQEALNCYQEAQEIDPLNDVAVSGLGAIWLNIGKLQLEQFEEESTKVAGELTEELVKQRNEAVAILNRSIEQLRKSIELDPVDFRYRFWLGEALIWLASVEGQDEARLKQEGLASWKDALDLEPENEDLKAMIEEHSDGEQASDDAEEDDAEENEIQQE